MTALSSFSSWFLSSFASLGASRPLNASWKICCLAVNGQSFLVIDGYLISFWWNLHKTSSISWDFINPTVSCSLSTNGFLVHQQACLLSQLVSHHFYLLVISSGYKVISISCEGGAAGRDWWCTKGKGKVDRCLTPSSCKLFYNFSFLLEKSIMDGLYVIYILVEHHLYFFFYFYIFLELYLMLHTFIIQILGFPELFFSFY